MAEHEPFPIADFRAGQFSGKEPWLSPANAFKALTDGRIYRGRLEKRRGYSRLSELGVAATTKNGTGTGANWNTIYSTFSIGSDGRIADFIPETALFEWEDASAGTLQAVLKIASYPVDPDAGDVDPTYGIDVVDAATESTVIGSWLDVVSGFAVTWNAHPDYTGAGPNRGTLDYYQPNDQAVLGIASFEANTGDEYLLAFDRTNVYVYDNTDGVFLEDPTAITLNGTDNDYFWTWPFDDYLMFTNNVDPVHKYTPGGSPTIEEIDTEFDSGSGGNDLDTCLIVLRHKGRAIFLNTKENGTRYPRRARWSLSGAFESHLTTGLDFADAPSHLGSITTAHMIADRIFVGFELGWMELAETGDSAAPFRWEVTTARHGAVAKMGTVPDSYRLLHRTEYAIEAIDPNGQYRVDAALPDYVLELDASKRNLCVGARNDPYRAFWWTFARNADETPARILAAQYDDKDELSWSVYRMAFNVFGTYSRVQPTTWDSYSPRSFDDLTFAWDSAKGTTGFRSLIGGTQDGTVYVFDDSDTDSGVAITMEATSQALSPFPGMRSHLGWIDIYGKAVSNATLTIGWSKDNRAAVEKSMTVDMTPDVVTNNVYRRVLVNKVASFHTLTLTLASSAFCAIDAIVPWFKPVSRAREFG